MNIKQFFDAYEGIWAESNHSGDISTQDQCVDLWRVYNKKVVGGKFILGNAVDFWTNYPTESYDKITNASVSDVPRLGDVIIWGTKYGPYGHIAVCTDIADTKGFTSFDQNDPIDSPCHFQPHKYTGVLGWLRPKKLPPTTELIVTDQTHLIVDGEDREWQSWKSHIKDLRINLDNCRLTGKEIISESEGLKEQVRILKANQGAIAEKLGCGNSHDEIMNKLTVKVSEENQDTSWVPGFVGWISKLFHKRLEEIKKEGGVDNG